VLDWLRGNSTKRLPEYSAIQKTPCRGLPSELADMEAGLAFVDQRAAIERSLQEPPRRPDAEKPLFVELITADRRGVVTMTLPEDGSRCLPVFSTPFGATDYVRTLLGHGPSVEYVSSSPLELVTMLADLREEGIEHFTLDRCPRCNIFAAFGSSGVTTADRAIACWAIFKATKLAQMDLYLRYASDSARAGMLVVAREVALEAVAHVGHADPRAHLLLGQIAVALQDRKLLREVRAFLQFFQFNSSECRLDDVIRSGSPDFDFNV
jgi:hypothetical protein